MTIGSMVPWSWRRRTSPLTKGDEGTFFSLQSDVNRLFDNFFSDLGVDSWSDSPVVNGTFTPKIDVTEDASKIKVIAELPGIAREDVDISLSGDSLVIKGEKKIEREEGKEGKGRYYFERHYGSFQRVIPLTSEVEEDKIDASFKNGVLTIVMPRTMEAQKQNRKISVRES